MGAQPAPVPEQELREWAARIVAKAPPLTPERAERLRSILRD